MAKRDKSPKPKLRPEGLGSKRESSPRPRLRPDPERQYGLAEVEARADFDPAMHWNPLARLGFEGFSTDKAGSGSGDIAQPAFYAPSTMTKKEAVEESYGAHVPYDKALTVNPDDIFVDPDLANRRVWAHEMTHRGIQRILDDINNHPEGVEQGVKDFKDRYGEDTFRLLTARTAKSHEGITEMFDDIADSAFRGKPEEEYLDDSTVEEIKRFQRTAKRKPEDRWQINKDAYRPYIKLMEAAQDILTDQGEPPQSETPEESLLDKIKIRLGFSEGGVTNNFKSDLEMDRQELMEQGFDPDYNDRDDSLTGDPTSGTDLAKSLGKAGFAGLSLIARQLGFDFYPTEDTERAIEKRLGFAEGGDTYGMASQMEQLDFVQPSITKPPLEKPKAVSRRPGFRGDGPLDFKGFGSYLKEQVSQEELTAGLDNAGEWMVPFYEAGSNMANVISEYNKPEDERDYDYIKEELGKAGNSAATEAAMWLMGGIAVKYGGKGIKAIADKVKQYEIDPNTTSAFGVGAIRKKDTFEEVMTPVKVSSKGTQKTGEAILRPSADLAEDLDPRMGRAMAADTAGSVMPGPGKFFDPSKKGYKGDRFTGMLKDADIELDLEFGNYIMMGKGAPKDVSNETFENLFVSARPSQKRTTFGQNNKSVARANIYDGPSLTVADMKANYKAATGKTGSEVRTNLLQPERFKIVTDEGDRLLDHPIVAVETKGKGGKHFYTLDTQFVGPVRMDRLTQKAKRKNPRTGEVREEVPQPNLRPATVGDVKVGEQIGTIRVGKKDHPLYDYIEVDATMSAPEGMGSIPKFNEGGMAMKEQMGYALGGDVEIDAESGNEVPPGSRPEEVRDDIPAMLSEGEYVVPADVTRFYGLKFFEDLRENAKQELAEMDANGRIGGEPVPETEDDLTEDEMSLLGEVMAMNQGGMVPQMNQQQMMNPIPSVVPQMQQMQQQPQPTAYNQPAGMAVGGMVGQNPNVDAFGNPIGPSIPTTPQNPTSLQPIDPSTSNIYGLNKSATGTPTTSVQVDSPISTTPTTPTGDSSGMKSVFYIHKDGRRISVLMLNGRPISTTPADFNEFVEDTPENRAKLNFTEPGGGGSGGGAGGGAGGGTATEGTQGTDTDDDYGLSTDVYKTTAEGGGVKDVTTPEGAQKTYTDSGVDVNDTVGAAKKALDSAVSIPREVGMIAGAINPFLGLAAGVGNIGSQLTAVSKAQANKRMAEFLGKTEDANAIQADIDRFLQNAPGAVTTFDGALAKGDQRFQDALAASTSVNAPDEAIIFPDDLNDVGRANLKEYTDSFKTAATTSRDVSIRPMLRPEGLGGVETKAEEEAAPAGLATKTDNPKVTLGKTLDTGVIGNNTSGRNTASQNLANSLTPNDGKVYVDGVLREEKTQRYSPQEVSQAESTASAATNDWVAATNAAQNVSTDDPRAWHEAMQAQAEASRQATAAIQERTRARNNDDDPSNDSPSSGGGCCFIMLEARYGNGTMDEVVRRYRDEYMTDRNRRGYYRTAEVLVPLMRKSKVFKWVVTKTFADPLVSYGKYYYGQNKHGVIYSPVKNFWMKVFDIVGGDTEFIRENGEVV